MDRTVHRVRTPKDRQQEILRSLQARYSSEDVSNIRELMDLLLEETKRNLVACPSDEFARLQGEAQAYMRVLKLLRRAPLPTTYEKQE